MSEQAHVRSYVNKIRRNVEEKINYEQEKAENIISHDDCSLGRLSKLTKSELSIIIFKLSMSRVTCFSMTKQLQHYIEMLGERYISTQHELAGHKTRNVDNMLATFEEQKMRQQLQAAKQSILERSYDDAKLRYSPASEMSRRASRNAMDKMKLDDGAISREIKFLQGEIAGLKLQSSVGPGDAEPSFRATIREEIRAIIPAISQEISKSRVGRAGTDSKKTRIEKMMSEFMWAMVSRKLLEDNAKVQKNIQMLNSRGGSIRGGSVSQKGGMGRRGSGVYKISTMKSLTKLTWALVIKKFRKDKAPRDLVARLERRVQAMNKKREQPPRVRRRTLDEVPEMYLENTFAHLSNLTYAILLRKLKKDRCAKDRIVRVERIVHKLKSTRLPRSPRPIAAQEATFARLPANTTGARLPANTGGTRLYQRRQSEVGVFYKISTFKSLAKLTWALVIKKFKKDRAPRDLVTRLEKRIDKMHKLRAKGTTKKRRNTLDDIPELFNGYTMRSLSRLTWAILVKKLKKDKTAPDQLKRIQVRIKARVTHDDARTKKTSRNGRRMSMVFKESTLLCLNKYTWAIVVKRLKKDRAPKDQIARIEKKIKSRAKARSKKSPRQKRSTIPGEGLKNFALSKLMWAMVVSTLKYDGAPGEVIGRVEKYALAIKRAGAGGKSPQTKRKWAGMVNKLSAVNKLAEASGSRC